MACISPVGVFDSGLGGVSVLREALKILPRENFIYYGDNQNAPYGDKTPDQIRALTLKGAEFLLQKGAKALLVACNTATAAAMETLRPACPVPVVSVEPAIKPACEAGGTGLILMLATRATTRLMRYQALKARMPAPERVVDVACSGVVERIESGRWGEADFDDLLFSALAPYEGKKVDAIVLGCTHFPLIRPAIARYARAHFTGEMRFYDSGAPTSRQLARVLMANGLENDAGGASVEFFTSGDREKIFPLFKSLINL